MTASRAEYLFKAHLKFLKHLRWHKGLNRSSEAAPVNTAGTLSLKYALRNVKPYSQSLIFYIVGRKNVLQILIGAVAALPD